MNNPKIIIYMSCYNHEKFVKEAMDSVINQTYTNWELYVVNDGSTDSTGKILADYKDKRINFFDFKENTAFIGAANFLMNLVEKKDGKYITIFSSDDKWELDKLEKQVHILEMHPEYKCCFTWDKILLNVEDEYKNMPNYSHKKNMSRYDWVDYYFHNGNCMNACSALMHKDVFYELGRMNENYRLIGDYRLWLRLACKYPFFVLNEELTLYRRHEHNLSKLSMETIVKNANEEYQTYLEVFSEIDEDTFWKSFYRRLPYSVCSSHEEFLADRFIVLLNTGSRTYEQAAMKLYFDWCDNQNFLDCLEQRYGFKPVDFMELTEKGGLQYFLAEVTNKNRLTVMKNRFTPAHILLWALENGEVNEGSMSKFAYSMLVSLLKNVQSQSFDTVNNRIMQMREERLKNVAKKKVAFFIGEESKMDVEAEFSHIIGNSENTYFFAVIPTKECMFRDEQKNSHQYNKISKLEHISLYDEQEHRVRFLSELDITVDVIYYVDCIDEEYPCMDMIAGYPLSVRNIGVVSEKKYLDMFQEDKKIKIFDEIYTYGE